MPGRSFLAEGHYWGRNNSSEVEEIGRESARKVGLLPGRMYSLLSRNYLEKLFHGLHSKLSRQASSSTSQFSPWTQLVGNEKRVNILRPVSDHLPLETNSFHVSEKRQLCPASACFRGSTIPRILSLYDLFNIFAALKITLFSHYVLVLNRLRWITSETTFSYIILLPLFFLQMTLTLCTKN